MWPAGSGFRSKNVEKYFLQAFRRSTLVFSANATLYLRVLYISADQCCLSISRYQGKRVIQSSVAKFFSALRALGLQKQNFLRAARAGYQRKRVTQSSVVNIFALRAPGLQKQNLSPLRAPDIRENG